MCMAYTRNIFWLGLGFVLLALSSCAKAPYILPTTLLQAQCPSNQITQFYSVPLPTANYTCCSPNTPQTTLAFFGDTEIVTPPPIQMKMDSKSVAMSSSTETRTCVRTDSLSPLNNARISVLGSMTCHTFYAPHEHTQCSCVNTCNCGRGDRAIVCDCPGGLVPTVSVPQNSLRQNAEYIGQPLVSDCGGSPIPRVDQFKN